MCGGGALAATAGTTRIKINPFNPRIHAFAISTTQHEGMTLLVLNRYALVIEWIMHRELFKKV
jgi:hypothetical protein